MTAEQVEIIYEDDTHEVIAAADLARDTFAVELNDHNIQKGSNAVWSYSYG